MSPQNQPKITKAERTSAAREQAKLIREAELKRQKRNSWLIRGGVLVAAIAIIVVVALIVISTMRNNAPVADSGPVAANMNSNGGVVIGKDSKVVPPASPAGEVDKSTLPAAPTTTQSGVTDLAGLGIAATAVGQPVQVVLYVDLICPACNAFEKANAPVLKQLADQGTITYEYRSLGFLDRNSTTNYSSRAGAAAAAVANNNPDVYLPFVNKLFENQPQEGGAGLSNDQLKQYAKDLGANIDSAVDERTYRPSIAYTTQQAQVHGVAATPTIFVDGQVFQSKSQFTDFQSFVQGIADAKK